MTTNNYTSIDYLIKQDPQSIVNKQHKEAEPVLSPKESEEIKIQEAVEHQPEEEVAPYVTPRAETIELPPDLKKMGLKATPTTKFPSYQNITIPLADDKVLSGLHAPITSSLRWLATLAMYILRKAHLGLKKVHGHVVRVILK